MKTPDQRGAIGWWTYQNREKRNWSVEQLVEKMDPLSQVKPSTIRGIESGNKHPSARTIRGLEAAFGIPAPDTEKERAGDMPALVSALRDQTAAINDLVVTIRDLVQTQPRSMGEADVRAMVEALLRARWPDDEPPQPQSGTPT